MTTSKWWCRWFVPGEDPRPVACPTPISWWHTGSQGEPLQQVVCGMVIAGDEQDALEVVQANGWPECKSLDFCEPKEPGWQPSPNRFPPPSRRSLKTL